MQAASSAEERHTVGAALPLGGKLLLVALNWLPGLHAAAVLAVLLRAPFSWTGRCAAAAAVLYLAPPILVRLLFAACGKPRGRFPVGGKAFFVWWISFQLQVLFCRFPGLEEALRLVPGLYSFWLRLWGSRVGRLTYWAAGTAVLDRSYLDVGDDVTLGAAVRLNGHVIGPGEDGVLELVIDAVVLGHRCSVGGYALLTAGSSVAEGEATRAAILSPPYTHWQGGRHHGRGKQP